MARDDCNEFDDLNVPPRELSDAEQAAILLTYFSQIIETMNGPTLVAFRAQCLARYPAGPEQTALLQQIDGTLALLKVGAGGQ